MANRVPAPAEPAVGVHWLIRWASVAWLTLKRPFLLRRVRKTSLEEIEGVPFLVLPEVHNPVVFRSGALLAGAAAVCPEAAPPSGQSPARALDMGTGAGACAVFAARRGYRVVAVDLNPEAVRCARINALLNRVEAQVEVRDGDLFEPLQDGERFHLVCFNPPFFRGRPRDRADMAWRSTNVMERFAAGLPARLAPGGKVLLALSTDGDAPGMLAAMEESGFSMKRILRKHFGNEIMTIYLGVR